MGIHSYEYSSRTGKVSLFVGQLYDVMEIIIGTGNCELQT